jgi:hypothetical protein
MNLRIQSVSSDYEHDTFHLFVLPFPWMLVFGVRLAHCETFVGGLHLFPNKAWAETETFLFFATEQINRIM